MTDERLREEKSSTDERLREEKSSTDERLREEKSSTDERSREESGGQVEMLSKGLAYGWLSARRRIGEMVLPVITTATGAFLVVIVFGMADGIRAQSASLGHADEIGRAVMLIAVTVLLVGVVEVAVATTRTVAHRTKELGVLGANGIPRKPVIAALLVEPMVAAVLGAVAGAALAAVIGLALGALGLVATGVSAAGLFVGAGIAIVVSIAAAIATSILPTWTAASRPPIRSLSTGG